MLNTQRIIRDRPHSRRPGHRPPLRRGFAIAELVAILAIALVAAALLTLAASRAHRLASLSESVANLKRLGEGTLSYAADNQELYFSFSWRSDRIGPTTYADLRAQAELGGFEPLSAQAVDIIRRRTGRESFEIINGWLPMVYYTHLVLADYYAESLPIWWGLSPEDKNRLKWASDPIGFANGRFTPSPSPLSPRWPYSSSYERALCLSSWDFWSATHGVISQGSNHNYFATVAAGNGDPNFLADRRTPETAFPSHKAIQWDSAQRHHGVQEQYFMFPDSRVPILFADGAVRVRATGNANRGVSPEFPRSSVPLQVPYQPDLWEPPMRGGGASPYVYTHFRFTRSGLAGRDFDGDEVPVP